MNPPDHNPSNLPKPVHGEAADLRSVAEPVGTPKPEFHPNPVPIAKPRTKTQGDQIFEIYLAKATAEARKHGNLHFSQAALEKAARTVAEKKTRKRLQEAYKYAVHSAQAETIAAVEILTELLQEFGIKDMKLCRKEPKKKGSKGSKKKGENHGV